MKRVIGLGLLFFSLGLLMGCFITNMFIKVLLMIIFMTAGYILFCK